MEQVLERLTNPELLFGLGVRFFGVFAVLIVVMVALQLTGYFYTRMQQREAASRAGGKPADGAAPAGKGESPPGEPAGIPGEVVAAIALALGERLGRGGVPVRAVPVGAAQGGGQSPWKLLGRHHALLRHDLRLVGSNRKQPTGNTER